MDFYTEFIQANELEDMEAVCIKYNKSWKDAKSALVSATKIAMGMENDTITQYHALIKKWLIKKGL